MYASRHKKSTLYAWTSRRRIPFLKINGLLRFREKNLEQWLRKKKIEDNISEDLTGMEGKKHGSADEKGKFLVL